MLAGLSPSRLAVANTVLASVVAGGLGVLVAPLIALDAQTLAFQVVPALAAALLAGFDVVLHRVFRRTRHRRDAGAPRLLGDAGLVPERRRRSADLEGCPSSSSSSSSSSRCSCAGRACPAEANWSSGDSRPCPAPSGCSGRPAIAAVVGVACLIAFPFDFRQSLINSLLGVVICLSLVVIVGFVGQISVVQLALAGVAGFTMSHLTTDVGGIWAEFPISLLIGAATATVVGLLIAVSALRVRGVSLVVVTLAAAVALEQFGFLNERWGGGSTGSPITPPKLGGLDPSSQASFRGLERSPARSSASSCSLRPWPSACSSRTCGARAWGSGCSPCARTSAPRRQPGSTSATRSSRDSASPPSSQAWPDAVRLQLRVGQLQPLRCPDGARPDRVRLFRRHHDGLRRGARGRRCDGGSLPARVRPLARPFRELGVAHRWVRIDRHAPRQPGGHRRHGIQEEAAEEAAARRRGCGGCPKRGCGSSATRGRATEPDAPANGCRRPRHHGHLGLVRRPACPRRRRAHGAGGSARRADRAERRGEDDLHRRDLGVDCPTKGGSSWTGGSRTGLRHTPAPSAGWRGRGSRSSCSTT